MTKNIIFIIVLLMLSGCASVDTNPPATDLSGFGKAGVITFEVENAKGKLNELATGILLTHLKKASPGTRFVQLGKRKDIPMESGADLSSPESIMFIGKKSGVDLLFTGRIVVSNIVPRLRIGSLLHKRNIKATFTMTVSGTLYSTSDGTVVWSDTVTKRGNAAYVHITKSLVPDFDVRDMDESYRKFIRKIIYRLTRNI